MPIFLAFNEKPSGIFTSQVVDVVKLLGTREKVLLVSFISWRIFRTSRNQIKAQYKHSIVLPIILGLRCWKWNIPIFRMINKIYGNKICIARSPLACKIALGAKTKVVCYDGRAAVKAEIEEFQVIEDPKLANEVISAEKESVLKSNFRIAVSQELIHYWRNEFGYDKDDHTIIPCTLSDHFADKIDLEKTSKLRKELGIEKDDIVCCFSGGNGGWNSLERTFRIFTPILKNNSQIKLLLLTPNKPYIEDFVQQFPQQIFRLWVGHDEVKEYLSLGDYGLLIREDKITNNVASPVKFAEYLSLGLNIIISDNIRDYAQFVEKYNCGLVLRESTQLILTKTLSHKRLENKNTAQNHLSKTAKSIRERYIELLTHLSDVIPNAEK